MHELVLFCLRCCGLAADIEEGEALDADGVVDVLERIQDESVKVCMPKSGEEKADYARRALRYTPSSPRRRPSDHSAQTSTSSSLI